MATSNDYLRATLIYLQGLKHYRAKDWEMAQKHFANAVQITPEMAAAHFKLGMCNFRLEQWRQALDSMQTAIELDPSKTRWTVQRDQALAYLKAEPRKTLSEKEELLHATIAATDADAATYHQLAANFRAQGRIWQEIEALKEAIARAPAQANLHFDLGTALERMNRFQEAAVAFEEASKLKPEDANYAFRMGFAYEREGFDGPANAGKASQAYEYAIAADRSGAAANFGIGVFHQKRGYWREASQAYEQRLGQDSCNPELLYRLGLSCDRQFKWAEAETHIAKSLVLDHTHAHWHNRLGFVQERQGKFAEAAIAYACAAELSDKGAKDRRYRQGYVLTKAGAFEEATKAFKKMNAQPEEEAVPDALQENQEGETKDSVLDDRVERLLVERIELLEDELKSDFTSPKVHFRLAEAHELLGNWEAAAVSYRRALQRSSDHQADWYFRLGNALATLGRFEEACDAFVETEQLASPDGGISRNALKNRNAMRRASYAEYYERLAISPKTVLYESFHGRAMSCNPLAIFRELLTDKEFADWTHIWVLDDLSKVPSEFRALKNVRYLKRESDGYLRALASAKVLINNATFPVEFTRKDNQIYLNTWHGTPIKTLGKFIGGSVSGHANTARNFLQATHLLSPNAHTSEVLIEHYDIGSLYAGEIAETGYPRIDATVALSQDARDNLRTRLGASPNQKILLYAPTYRGNFGGAELDSEALLADLQAMQQEGYHLVFRGHYETEQLIKGVELDCTVVPEDVDSNSLLAVVDLLVSDYSSIAIDYLPRRKPIIYYAYDLEDYDNERGLYFPLSELPGTIVQDRAELSAAIANAAAQFDPVKHEAAVERFSPFDDGNVSARVVDWVFREDSASVEIVTKKTSCDVLFYPGSMKPNGITTSILNLCSKIDRAKHKIAFLIDSDISQSEDCIEQVSKLPDDVDVILRVGARLLTLEEQWVENKLDTQHIIGDEMSAVLERGYRRELRRQLGPLKVDTMVNFDGYTRLFHRLFAFSPDNASARKVLYLHNDIIGEWRERIPFFGGSCRLYDRYSTLVSVSKSIGEVNKQDLTSYFEIDPAKFTYSPNVLNPNYVLEASEADLENPDEAKLFKRGSPIFITMARLSVEKGQDKLVRAFAKVVRQAPEAKLIILGDGPLREDLRALIREFGLSQKVHLLGHRANPFPYLKRADYFVFPSNHEGQGLVLLEAMILGKPVIASDIPTSREILSDTPDRIVENTEDGFAEAMLKVINNPLSQTEFDIEAYQKEAIGRFYREVLGEDVA